MTIKYALFIILLLCSSLTSGQTKSLRELFLEADVVAITEKFPNPFFPNEKKMALSDYQNVTIVDSIHIISYFKKGKKDLSSQKLIIKTDLGNAFFQNFRKPEVVEPLSPYTKPLAYKTIFFAKTQKYFSELLYFKEIDEEHLTNIENFIIWMENTQKEKNEEERCRLYINKYLSMLERNEVSKDFMFFENILLPTSNFMLYYGNKTPNAKMLTTDQKDRLKNYVFDNYFSDIENTKLVYEFYPAETLELYKIKLSEINTYDNEFDNYSTQYNPYLEFVLKKTDKWNRDTELLLEILDDYNSNNKSLKRDAFERLVEKINEK